MPSDLNTEHKKRQLRSGIRACRMVLFILLLTVFTLVHNPWTVQAQSQADGPTHVQPKRILVVYSYGYALPAYQKFNPAFISAMESAGVRNSDMFFEYLDLLHVKYKEHR